MRNVLFVSDSETTKQTFELLTYFFVSINYFEGTENDFLYFSILF